MLLLTDRNLVSDSVRLKKRPGLTCNEMLDSDDVLRIEDEEDVRTKVLFHDPLALCCS